MPTLNSKKSVKNKKKNLAAISPKPLASPKAGRSSKTSSANFEVNILRDYKDLAILKPAWYLPIIPIIRKLVQSNPDLGQTLNNVITLGNTGHKVFFDPKVGEAEVEKMRTHLENKVKSWTPLLPGMDGFVNRLISQAMIGGALSCEWVVQDDLKGVEIPILVNPDEIRFKLSTRGLSYDSYQYIDAKGKTKDLGGKKLIKLNPLTYKYFSINGDGDSPYGFPPYLKALRAIKSQTKMLDSIDAVIDQLGIMGFISVMIERPELLGSESEADNLAAQEALLDAAKDRISEGIRNGSVVGFKDYHDINFHSTTKDFNGVTKIFENNELMAASGLNMDAALLGRGYSTSESQITIIFTKLLSELRNIQSALINMLQFGYELELRLAGFSFESLRVRFNKSTIQDELKYQQGLEYKIKNLHSLRVDGIISQDDYADEMDIPKPYKQEPIVPFEDQDGKGIKSEGLDKKNASERKTTDKKKPQGTIKKTNNK